MTGDSQGSRAVLGAGLIVLVIVLLWSILFIQYFDLAFQDYAVYRSVPTSEVPVPRFLHQTWKNHDLNESQKQSVSSLKAAYPTYEHRLWTDDMLDDFARQEFPDFYADTWQRLTPFIKKVDTWRYMVLYIMGGLYCDIDTQRHRNAEHIWNKFPGYAFVPTRSSRVNWDDDTDAASPAVLFSYPGHPFWLLMLDYIREQHTPEFLAQNPNEEVIACTGPIAVSRVLLRMEKGEVNADGIVFLSEARFGLGGLKDLFAKYCIHENRNTETWRKTL